jgi:hypothetical protein
MTTKDLEASSQEQQKEWIEKLNIFFLCVVHIQKRNGKNIQQRGFASGHPPDY